jgi:riboflavin transporter FmnP
MDTKVIAFVIIFSALAIALNPIAIPSVFLRGWGFRLWEIPIVIAFLLFGLKVGVTVALVHTLAELTIFPSPVGFLGPPAALLGTLVMLLGLYIGDVLIRKRYAQRGIGAKKGGYYITFGTLARLAFSPIAAFLIYGVLIPLTGVYIPMSTIMGLIPLVLLFDLILSLYTIPIGYLIARLISNSLRIGKQL